MAARAVVPALLALGLLVARPAPAEPLLVIVVRHAERASEPAADPALTLAGTLRAEALATALADARIGTIFTTSYRRTRDTARPLATRLGIEPQAVAARHGGAESHIQDVAAAVRHASGNVLVVGHSNTVTGIVAALGGPVWPPLCDSSFGQAFAVQPQGAQTSVLRLRYGEADPEPGVGCL
jgi:phosphohistidine phosphatase SixA